LPRRYSIIFFFSLAVPLQVNVVATLPPHLQSFALAALGIPKGIGMAFQALDLALMCLFGGGAAGFVHGVGSCLAAPFRVLSTLSRYGASVFGFLSVGLSHGGYVAAATARALSPRPMRSA